MKFAKGFQQAKQVVDVLGSINKCPYCSQRLKEIQVCAKNMHRDSLNLAELEKVTDAI